MPSCQGYYPEQDIEDETSVLSDPTLIVVGPDERVGESHEHRPGAAVDHEPATSGAAV